MQPNQNSVTEADLIDKLPHLPALESVEQKGWTYFSFALVFIALLLNFPIGGVRLIAKYWQFLGGFRNITVVIVGTSALLLLYLIISLLSTELYFKTDEQGLVTRSIIRRKYIAWQDVIDAATESTLTGHTIYRLKTKKRTVIVSATSNNFDISYLAASIMQHLRKQGKAKSIRLPSSSLSLWDRIPDEVPASMDINTSTRRTDTVSIISLVIMLVAVSMSSVWITISAILSRDFPLAVISGIGGLFVISLSLCNRIFPRTTKISIRSEYFEVRNNKRKATVQWSDVTHADWYPSGILIRTANPRTKVLIPIGIFDEDNFKLTLAVIRRLRTAGVPQALTIPYTLRANWRAGTVGRTHQEPIELRLSKLERFAMTGLIPLFGLVLLPNFVLRPRLYVPAALASLAVWWIACRIAVLSTMVVNEEGITRRSIWQKKTVKWEDVASVSFGSQIILLKGADGKAMLNVFPIYGSELDKQEFYTLLFAKLSDRLPSEAAIKPWKSRPWRPDRLA
ncbi:MAG: hypothetical protein ABFD64_08290 [Armatimonadota bacterium]